MEQMEQMDLNMATQKTRAAASKAKVKKPAPGKKLAPKKPAAKRKPTTAKKTVKKAQKKSKPDFAAIAQDASRNAFLAGLGFYGKAFDQAQEQFNGVQRQLEESLTKANEMYEELVQRGEKLEADTKEAIEGLELPDFKIQGLANREKLEARLAAAKTRFSELKKSAKLTPSA